MRKVNLRMNELEKYEVIKKLVISNGNKKRAALKLNCSIRTINRLIIKYNTLGKEGFIHGNRNRIPSTSIPLNIKNKVISLYINDFHDTNYVHFCEILKEDYDITVSDSTLNVWLRDENILSPKAHRKTKKYLKQKLKIESSQTASKRKRDELNNTIILLDESSAHPRRSRCKYKGEMIQMDASSYQWIPGVTWHLHLAVDDASGEVVGAYFDMQETLKGYYHVLYEILTNHGIPALFYTDRRTVFEYKRKNNPLDDDDTFTQFSYACHTLGIDIKTTSVAQAKGRIERLNQTFQSRLPVELRRAQITNIDEANKFLKSYLKKFNSQFALHIHSSESVYEKQPSIEIINRTLAVISERKIDSGHCIKYKNKFYLPVSEKGIKHYFKRKSSGFVIESFDETLYFNMLDHILLLEEVPKHVRFSKEFDHDYKEVKPKVKYIPPLDHPWRTDNIMNYFGSQKHREQTSTYN